MDDSITTSVGLHTLGTLWCNVNEGTLASTQCCRLMNVCFIHERAGHGVEVSMQTSYSLIVLYIGKGILHPKKRLKKRKLYNK